MAYKENVVRRKAREAIEIRYRRPEINRNGGWLRLNKIAGRLEPRRPPMKDEGTETAFRLDQCKHFRKSKHLLRSEVNRCDQSSIELHLRRSTSTGE